MTSIFLPLKDKTVSLIGMPGSGKTTIGLQLAEQLEYQFLDTDHLLENTYSRSLQSLLDEYGYLGLRDLESNILKTLTYQKAIISTGGSAVYSEEGMAILKEISHVVFLRIEFNEVFTRINNFSERGISKPQHQSLQDLYFERELLYQKYADLIIDNNKTSPSKTCQHIISHLQI